MSSYLPLEFLAQQHDVDPLWLAWWCQTGRVEARRLGQRWFVSPESLADYLVAHPPDTERHWVEKLNSERPRLMIGVVILALGIIFLTGREAVMPAAHQKLASPTVYGNSALILTDRGGVSPALESLPWRSGLRLARGFWSEWINQVFKNWYGFVTGRTSDDQQALADIARLSRYLEIREQLKKEIIEELGRDATRTFTPVVRPDHGVVVVPGGTGDDQQLKNQLQNFFSDEVRVRFDETGVSGVITPVFRGTDERGNYVFVLTPIRSQ